MERSKFLYEFHKASEELDKKRLKKIIRKEMEAFPNEKPGQHQSIMIMEEMSELIQEVSKYLRGMGNKHNLLQEMADVYISLESLKEIYGITSLELHKAVNVKIDRIDKELKERGVYR